MFSRIVTSSLSSNTCLFRSSVDNELVLQSAAGRDFCSLNLANWATKAENQTSLKCFLTFGKYFYEMRKRKHQKENLLLLNILPHLKKETHKEENRGWFQVQKGAAQCSKTSPNPVLSPLFPKISRKSSIPPFIRSKGAERKCWRAEMQTLSLSRTVEVLMSDKAFSLSGEGTWVCSV